MDPTYEPDAMETRTLYGMQLTQLRNNADITKKMFGNVVTDKNEVCGSADSSLLRIHRNHCMVIANILKG